MSKEAMKLALEAGFWRESINTWMCSTEDIELFANLIRADERARLAEQPAPVQEPVAFCDPSDPNASTAFSWPGFDRQPHHTATLCTTPQPAPVQQEPVAWMRQDGQRVVTANDRSNYPDYKTRYSVPLYTAPQAQPAHPLDAAIEATHGIKENQS